MNVHGPNVSLSPPIIKIRTNRSPNSLIHNQVMYINGANSSINYKSCLNSSITQSTNFKASGTIKPTSPLTNKNIVLVESRHQNVVNLPFNENYPKTHSEISRTRMTPRKYENVVQGRYSKELDQIKQQLLFLSINIQKLEEEVSFKKTNNGCPSNHKQSKAQEENHLCLSFIQNTEKEFYQKHCNNEALQNLSQEGKSLLRVQKYVQNSNSSRTDEKIGLIYHKLCTLESMICFGQQENHSKCKNKNQSDDNNLFCLLMETIKQKSMQLKKFQINYLPYHLNVQTTQSQLYNELPDEWNKFQSILDTVTAKIQIMVSQPNHFNHEISRMQYDRLLNQKNIRETQNQRLKLQYTKLKNEILNLNNQSENMHNQLSQYQEQPSEISKLQEIIETQNQKISLMTTIIKKKQQIEHDFNQILIELNDKILSQQTIIKQIKNKQSYNESQNQSYNQSFNANIVKELSTLLNIQTEQGSSLEVLLQKIRQKNYSNIYSRYIEIIKLFGVSIDDSHCHEILMGEIQLFRTDIQILFGNIEQLTIQNRNKTNQNESLREQILNYKLKLQQNNIITNNIQNKQETYQKVNMSKVKLSKITPIQTIQEEKLPIDDETP